MTKGAVVPLVQGLPLELPPTFSVLNNAFISTNTSWRNLVIKKLALRVQVVRVVRHSGTAQSVGNSCFESPHPQKTYKEV